MTLSVFNNDSNASMSVVISVICLKSGENEVFKNIDFSRVRIPIPRGPQRAGVYAVNLFLKNEKRPLTFDFFI